MMKNLEKKVSLLTARTVNLFQRFPKKNIFYLHIPKCGGTSLNQALQCCFLNWSLSDTSNMFNLDSPASWEAIERTSGLKLLPDTVDDHSVMKLREEILAYYMCQRHINYISGHFPFSSNLYNHFCDQYSFITVLRDPIKRWVSSYFYNKNRQPSKHRKLDNINIENYLKSNYGKSQGYEYSKFLGGIDQDGNFMTQNAVNRAKENLHKFRLVGFLEDMDCFLDKFAEYFGRQLNIGYLNQKSTLEAEEMAQVEQKYANEIAEICQYDLEIYNYAVENLSSSKRG